MGMSSEFTARLAVGVLVSLLAVARPVAADHIGVLQFNQEPAGPYAVSVWTEPGTIRARGSGTVTVAVMRPHTRVALTDVTVHVTAHSMGSPTVSAEATLARDPLGLRYLADLRLPEPGRWTVHLAVQGPAGSGAVDFPLDVAPASWTEWGWWALVAVGIGVLAAAALRRRARIRPAPVTASPPKGPRTSPRVGRGATGPGPHPD